MPSWEESVIPIENDGGFTGCEWFWCLASWLGWLGLRLETNEIKELVGKSKEAGASDATGTFTFGLFVLR
jgi:hypothetical protein